MGAVTAQCPEEGIQCALDCAEKQSIGRIRENSEHSLLVTRATATERRRYNVQLRFARGIGGKRQLHSALHSGPPQTRWR